MGLEGGEKSYGIRLTGDGSGVAGMLESTAKAAEKTEKQLERTGDATQSSAQQSKSFAEALKQQTGALGDTSKALDKFEELTGRRIPSALRGLAAAAGPAALVVGALGFAAYTAIAQHVAFERQLTRTEVALIAQGRGAELSRERMADLTREVARLPGVSGDMAGQVVEAMSRVRSIGGAHMAELAKLTADWAAASGEDAPTAMRKLAAAIGDPARGVKTLQQEFGLLNAEQLMSIDRMLAYGQTSEAQGVLIDALKTRLQGLAEKGLSPVARLWERIKAAAQPAVEAMGNDVPEAAYLGTPVPRAFQADLRQADVDANERLAKSGYSFAQIYDVEGQRRLKLQGDIAQGTAAGGATGQKPEYYESVARSIANAKQQLANLDAEQDKATDGLQRYLVAATRTNAMAQESVYGARTRTEAERQLAAVQDLVADGLIKNYNPATLEKIRNQLESAAAAQREAQAVELRIRALAAEDAQRSASRDVATQFNIAQSKRLEDLQFETRLTEEQAQRENQLRPIYANRLQQVAAEARLQALANAERERAIELRKLDEDRLRSYIDASNDEIEAVDRQYEASKRQINEATDARAAAQGARDAAHAVRQEWESEQRSLAQNVQGTLTHALVTAFLEGGRSGGEALKAALKSTMATLILEPLIRPLMMPIANFASQLSMSMFGSFAGSAGGSLAGDAGSLGSSVGFAGMGAWLGKIGAGGSALQVGGPGAGALTYTNAGGVTGASSGALATTGFGALALGDLLSAQNGRDWTRTLYGGAPPMAGRINDKLGIPQFFTDPLGSVFGHGGDTRKQYTLFVTRAANGSYQLEEGGNPPAGVPSDRVLQNLGSNVDMSMLNSLQLWEQGSHGEDENAVIARLMARIAPAILPDMATLVSSRAGLSGQLRQTLGVDSLQSFRDALNVSDLSGKGPTEQLAAARDIYERELGAVRGGDYSRVGNFESAAQQYLQLGRGMYATGSGYQDILSGVTSALDEIGAKQKDVLGDLATQVLQSGKDNVDAIDRQTKQLVDALKQVVDQIRRSSETA